MSKTLNTEVCSVDELDDDLIDTMYAIYSHYYAATARKRFSQDLMAKTHVVLLRDDTGVLRGFSTLEQYLKTIESIDEAMPGGGSDNHTVQVMFSGDTIIEHDFWGQQALPMAWIEQAGRFKAMHPDTPLYWFLIVKGYRTYRYLSAFSHRYYPHPVDSTPRDTQNLLNGLAGSRFGHAYCPTSGCIVFPESKGHLAEDWVDVPDRLRNKPEVSYFLQRNPEYYKGHELACITELSVDNLSRRARQAFERGLADC